MLLDLLSKGAPFSLGMAPGFFRIYAHVGIMHALEEANLLHVHSAAGSSAGAMGAGFLCSGMSPGEMIEKILAIKRPDIWDAELGFRLGLLKGELLQGIFERSMPVQDFKDCAIPCGMTALDVLAGKTTILNSGSIATNMRASACFPILFAPVDIHGRPFIDGGVWDRNGVLAIPSLPDTEEKLIVNIVFERPDPSDHYSLLPQRFQDEGATLLTIVVNGLVFCGPHNMEQTGPASYLGAKTAMLKALREPSHLILYGRKHFVVFLDASGEGEAEEQKGGVRKTTAPSRKRSRSKGTQ